MCSKQHMHNTEQEDRPYESIGAVPAKDPPKVKLESFPQL